MLLSPIPRITETNRQWALCWFLTDAIWLYIHIFWIFNPKPLSTLCSLSFGPDTGCRMINEITKPGTVSNASEK